ncbi:nucleotidyltransferase family protein [Aurantiacibacter flavus]|uniref:NTP transferase domain-containing protein n=1 Tax=Aurantiacibacter flavus TaxID=3145232 RepID=A0ABV0CVE6_9SPHN
MSVPLVAVLAAGEARRFGGGKLDALCAGQRVGAHVLAAVAEAGFASGVIVVPVSDVPMFAQEIGWPLIENPNAEAGLATSVALAAQTALAQKHDLLIVLADMPLVAPSHLAALAATEGLAASDYGTGKPGVPAFVPQELLAEITKLEGEGGAGRWLASRADCTLIAPPPSTLADVDRPEDIGPIEAALSARR